MSDQVDDAVQALVIDSGSGVTRAGFAGDDAPRTVFSSVIGTTRHQVVMQNMLTTGGKSTFIGERAQQERHLLSLRYPIEHGIVTNWEDMEQIWHHTVYNELRVDTEEHSVLLTEPPMNPKHNKEMMAQIMFEKFKVPAFYVSMQPTLSLYSSGRHGGVVVDIGDGVTHITPIMGIYSWTHAIKRSHLAGRDLTQYLAKLLTERGHYFQTTDEMEVVREIKEQLAYVATDYDEEIKKTKVSSQMESTYELPDGRKITLADEKFRCTEPIFNPSLIGMEQPGISEQIFKTIMATDINCRKHFYSNIILSGGTTMMPGTEERIQKEMKQLIPASCHVKVVAPPERKFSVWIGGSILASLSSFQNIAITREQYDETGPSIAHNCI